LWVVYSIQFQVSSSNGGKLFSIENDKLRIQLVGKVTYLCRGICFCNKILKEYLGNLLRILGSVSIVSWLLIQRFLYFKGMKDIQDPLKESLQFNNMSFTMPGSSSHSKL
jgi:hypothetical protein